MLMVKSTFDIQLYKPQQISNNQEHGLLGNEISGYIQIDLT